ncbi:MAG: universal stress protein [Lapillicoccus sp.]
MNAQLPSVVLGYDDQPASQGALTVAMDLAERLGAHLHVVHVVDLRDYPNDPDAWDWETQGRAQLDSEHQHVSAELASWSGQWTYHLRRGDPVRALSEIATESSALMIVVGTHSTGSVIQRLLALSPSVPHRLEHSGTPVLIVPAPLSPTAGS